MTSIDQGRDEVRALRQGLIEDIVAGRLRPGGELAVTHIAAARRKGAATVREAVRLLVGEGALAERSGRGFWIPILQPVDLRAYYAASAVIAAALVAAVIKSDVAHLVEDVAASDSLLTWPMPRALCRLSHVPALEAALSPIDAALLPYRRAEQHCIPDWADDHRHILACAGSRDRVALRRELSKWHRRRIACAEALVTIALRR